MSPHGSNKAKSQRGKRITCPHCGESCHPSTVSRHMAQVRKASTALPPNRAPIPLQLPQPQPGPSNPIRLPPADGSHSPLPITEATDEEEWEDVMDDEQNGLNNERSGLDNEQNGLDGPSDGIPSQRSSPEWMGVAPQARQIPFLPLPPPLTINPNEALRDLSIRQAGKLRQNAIDIESDEFTCIKAFKLQMEINLGHNAFHKLRKTFPEIPLPSLKVLRRQMKELSGLDFVPYDMCPNSCLLFAGRYASWTRCNLCKHPRRRPNGRPYKRFFYLPLIPQVQSLYSNTESAQAMLYRSTHHDINRLRDDGQISDIYDSDLYRSLRNLIVAVDGEELGHHFFSDPRDVLLACMTDGFQVFKRAKHTAWPLILVNMNLDPSIRYQWENVICLGLIPGPKKPKNFNSFLWVYTEELAQAARGVRTYDAITSSVFTLHVYAPYGSGDMPAIASAFTCTKNHNAKHPCRFCPIEGVRITNSKNRIHYVPITRPPNYQPNVLRADQLPSITHEQFLERAQLVDLAPTAKAREQLAQLYGINRTPITSLIPGVRFPDSFPSDFMHLLENLLKNYVKLISGDFKGLKNGRESYVLPEKTFKAIGAETFRANATIPAAFGRRIPNIADDRTYFTAEAYLVWFTLYAPILLRNRFPRRKYYKHFQLLVGIINRLLAIDSTREERDTLRRDIVSWYSEYEKIFYQYDPQRLPACLITVHVWLHLVDLIEKSGPLWAYWCWVMERYCSRLLRAVSSRKHPYASLNRRILDTQQLHVIRDSFNLRDALPRYTLAYNPRARVSWETADPSSPYFDLQLIGPRRVLHLNQPDHASLKNRIATHIMTQNKIRSRSLVLSQLPDTIERWTKILIKNGDTVSSRLGDNRPEENQRTASFCQYEQLVDALARNHTVEPALDGKTYFGELEQILLLELPENPLINQGKEDSLILLDIHSCVTQADEFGFFEYDRFGPREVVDGSGLRALVGRIKNGSKWTFVRRPGVLEHAIYINEDEELVLPDN